MALNSWLLLLTLAACTASRGSLALSRACSKLAEDDTSGDALVRMKPMKLTLLIRRVDDPNPYYKRARMRLKVVNGSTETLLVKLIEVLSSQLNVSNIERIVLNDLMVISTDADLLSLECDDRLEVAYRGCGPPTRAPTVSSTADGLRSVYAASLPGSEALASATNYLLLFTIRAGVGTPVWQAFSAAPGDASTPIVQSADVAMDFGQPDLFRAAALDKLNDLLDRLRRREILLVVYDESGSPALRLTFDIGDDKGPLTRYSWFSHSRLKSSWPIASIGARSFNHFAVAGDVDSRFERRFYVNYSYGGCPSDTGVLVVNDIADLCDYSKTAFTAAPMIAYTTSADGSWTRGLKRGRRMSIFAR